MVTFSILSLIIAGLLCFFMTWGVGANDLANVMSTTIGSKAVTAKQAILIAVIFEFAGAFIGGTGVTETMRDGIIRMSLLSHDNTIIIEGMISVLFACTVWMNLASYFGVPVSITNALVGSMVGFGSMVLGNDAVNWHQVLRIAVGWITSPLLAGIAGYLLFISIQQTIFIKDDPLYHAKKYIPIYLLLVGTILVLMTVFKGLHHFHIQLNFFWQVIVTVLSILFLTLISLILMYSVKEPQNLRRKDKFLQIEKYFAILMAITACAMAFAHGSNDVALAVGPLSIVYNFAINHDSFSNLGYPWWITMLACIGVTSGFLMYGRKVIETVGTSITALTPSRAFAATLAASSTVVFATGSGIPVSATQTLVGSVLGVGLARGIGALNLIVIRNIFTSWVLTLPAASILTIITYKLIHAIWPLLEHIGN